jgi:hypothetical protein
MEKMELKHFEKPDGVREFPDGRLERIKIGGATIGGALTREFTIFYFVIVIISVIAGSNFFRTSPLNA